MRKLLLAAGIAALVASAGFLYPQKAIHPGQEGMADARTSWGVSYNPAIAFIENKTQFSGRNMLPGTEVLYGVDYGSARIFFTKEGLTYRMDKYVKKPKTERAADLKAGVKFKTPAERKFRFFTDVLHMQWVDANADVRVAAHDLTADYHSYTFHAGEEVKNVNYIKGYEKIVYENLYPQVDAEYTIHPEGGIKYALVLHPGADVSNIKMKYSDANKMSRGEAGSLRFTTFRGDIIEHAPVTFYADNESSAISSEFVCEGDIISFRLGNYDHSKTVVIDPWVQMPAFVNSKGVWECEKDGAGNVYIIGGDSPMKLQKYNSTGTLQWTYNTPYDTLGYWLGTFATDLAGNCYVTSGAVAGMQKVNTSAGLQWNYTAPFLSVDEYWSIAFNCDQTKLVVGGTTAGGRGLAGAIFDINTATGNLIDKQIVAYGNPLGIPIEVQEVRAISSSRNAKYFFLTLDSVGAINQNLNACSGVPVFKENSTYHFSYKSETYRPENGNSGICAIRANQSFAYTQNGSTVHKRSPVTGAILATATIPGGITATDPVFGVNQPGNSGIDLDSCGNVYVGSANAVIKYDSDLNLITSVSLPFRVFDVTVGYNGEVIVCGASGDNTNTARTGYVQVVDMSACAPFALICCDATICPVDYFCTTDAAATLTAVTPGGTWGGPGITNSATGMFDPAAAGVGTHRIGYTLSCGTDSIDIDVFDCSPVVVCIENNGQYTATGGTGPYTWEHQVPTQDCSLCLPPIPPFIQPCSFPPGCATTVLAWTVYSTDSTITPPGTFPIIIYDSGINRDTINSAAELSPCNTCPAITVNISSQTNLACFGASNGSATASATGGTIPYTYSWQPGNLSGDSQSNLSGTTYTITATDANGCRGTGSVTITSPTAITMSLSQTNTSCAGNDGTATASASGGTPSYSYSWSTGDTTNAITGLQGGNYSVTVLDANSCQATGSVAITQIPGFTFSVSINDASCGNNDGSATITPSGGTPPFTYSWSTGGNTATVSNLPVGSYTATITDANSCSDTAAINISNVGGAVITFDSKTDVDCNGSSNGAINISVSGGSAPYSYSWSNGAVTEDISGLPGGNYAVSASDAAGCIAIFDTAITEPSALAVSGTVTNGSCTAPLGAITLSVSGGSPGYSYSWSNGAITQNLSNIAAGDYAVTVTDNNLCTETNSFTVNAPGSFTITLVADSALCAGSSDGSVASTVSGGNAPFQYSWSTGAVTSGIANVAKGTYSVTVTDFINCSVADTATVEAPQVITAIASITEVLCQGGNNGGIKLIPFGGTPDYTALWSNGDSGLTLTGLAPGIYTATITDANDCTADTTISLTAASVYEVETSVTNATCDGSSSGSAQANIINGNTPPYTFNWNTGDSLPTATNLVPGVYFVTVSDSLHCLRNDTAIVGTGSGMMIEDSVKPVSCPQARDGAIVVTVIGGTQPFTYSWSNGANTASNVNIGAGTYYLTVTDNEACTGMDTVLVWVDTLGNAECDTLVIYDVFTPNGDGANDQWVIDGLYSYSENELQVFNRWGSLVFEAKPYTGNWDGRSKKDELLPAATYYYILKLNDPNGSVYSGTVTLIR